MTRFVTYDCDCTFEPGIGQKRPRRCEHDNLYLSEKQAKNGGSSLSQGNGFAASPAQRAKVRGLPCAACGKEKSAFLAIDPAHVWPQGKGGCEHPDCVIPLCRTCHDLFDLGELDLLSRFADSEAWAVEQAHPILVHGVGLVELTRRLSGNGFDFVATREVDLMRARIVELEAASTPPTGLRVAR